MYRDQRNYENLNRAKFIGAGAFDIPRILAEVPATPQSWIGFNYAKSCKDPARLMTQSPPKRKAARAKARNPSSV